MSWKDAGKAAHKALQAGANDHAKSFSYGLQNYNQGYNLYQNPLIGMLQKHAESQDPRVKLPSYRALTHNLPIIKLAIEVHKKFIGNPRIIAGDKGNPKAVRILEEFWANSPIHGQWINPIAADKGIDSFTGQMVEAAFTDGSQFFRLMQQPTTARVNTSEIEGIRLFDSALFDYIPDPTDLERVRLQYASPVSGTIYIKPDMGYNELHFSNSPRFPWGQPMAFNAEFIAERFIRYLISYVNGAIRKGDPIGMTVIGFEAPPRGTMVNSKEFEAEKAQLMTDTRTLKDSHASAIKDQRRTSQPQDIVTILPGNIKVSQAYYGAAIDLPPQFSETATFLETNLARSLNTPFAFLGIIQGGGGIGSDMFRIQKDSLVLATDMERARVEMNCIRRICDAVLRANRVIATPDTYALEWQHADLSDEKLEAEARKISAEATALELLNITAINTELSGTSSNKMALNEYLEEIGRGSWKV